MSQRYESKWTASFKVLLYDLMISFRGSLFDVERFREEWLFLVGSQFRTKHVQLFGTGSLTEVKWTFEEQKKAEHAFAKPYLLYTGGQTDWPVSPLYNFGVRLIDKEMYLFMKVNKEVLADLEEEDLLFFTEESSRLMEWAHNMYEMRASVARYKELFNVTGKFHSSMNIEFVLKEIAATLQRIFPLYSYHFLMTMEGTYTGMPVSHFDFDKVSEEGMVSYTNGTVQVDDVNGILYAPLIGKQGVYGVLQVKLPKGEAISKQEQKFIRMVASAGGNAIEKAGLYHQSRKLNEDLRLINDTSHRVNSSSNFLDITNFLRLKIIHSFHACAVGFIFFNEQTTKVMAGSSSFFYKQEGEELIRFASNKLRKEKEAFFIGNLADKIEKCDLAGHTMMAVPMELGEEMKGFCLVVKNKSYGFTFEMYKLLQSLIRHSTLALANALLREELEKMVVTDHLTKLYSRSYLDQTLRTSTETDEAGVFLLIDIDDFKVINDTYGHETGDKVLIQVAQIVQAYVQNEQIAARWGGEELAVYLPNGSIEEGRELADKLVKEVETNTKPAVTISCGVSYWSKEHPDSRKHLFNCADAALYEAKRTGKNKVSLGQCCV
ncbi:GGDEF domain-containing protein [Bacillus sp. B190/17]|uniref:GGDEF domain-containing protein n=1 Tax=Bacillus lumedeiriae TaxID=3058829 RepID=A0ABW8I5B7_9BACI